MKKVLSLVLALMLVLTSVAAMAETVSLKVWGSQEDQAMLAEMVEAFKAANPDTEWDITFGVVGEPDAKAKYLEDPAAAADVFAHRHAAEHGEALLEIEWRYVHRPGDRGRGQLAREVVLDELNRISDDRHPFHARSLLCPTA